MILHIGVLPTIGTNYIYRLWWTTDQLQAVTNTSRQWTYEVYPSNGDHDHCILSWEPIGVDEVHKAGYRSGKDWITEEAYRTYIVNDKHRLRHRKK